MHGQNPIRKANYFTSDLRVQEIFRTIQSEGPFAGHGAIFIRLAGCSLKCWFCDTDFESNYDNIMKPREIRQKVAELINGDSIKLAVITGGEPMLQHLAPTISQLVMDLGMHVQIETSGTHCAPSIPLLASGKNLTIVCSPKTPKINKAIEDNCRHWKYVVSYLDDPQTRHSQNPEIYKDPFFPRSPGNIIYIQPMDESNEYTNMLNIQHCVTLCQKKGYVLSLQTHKMIGLP